MEAKDLLKIETIVLFAIVAMFVIVVIKMKPLKDFSKVKISKDGLELNRLGEYQKLLEFAEGFNKRLDYIDERLNNTDKRLDAHYTFIKDAVVAGHKNALWGDKSPPFSEVIDSGLKMLMLGQDGNVVTRIRECIMGLGKENGIKEYHSALNRFRNDNKDKLIGNLHFEQHLELIRQGLY
jgi:hypothetical protein